MQTEPPDSNHVARFKTEARARASALRKLTILSRVALALRDDAVQPAHNHLQLIPLLHPLRLKLHPLRLKLHPLRLHLGHLILNRLD